jgi:hypothetical protein
MICEWLMRRVVPNPPINYLAPRSVSAGANAGHEVSDPIAGKNRGQAPVFESGFPVCSRTDLLLECRHAKTGSDGD